MMSIARKQAKLKNLKEEMEKSSEMDDLIKELRETILARRNTLRRYLVGFVGPHTRMWKKFMRRNIVVRQEIIANAKRSCAILTEDKSLHSTTHSIGG